MSDTLPPKMGAGGGERARFGRFELDLQTGELSKDGRRIHLQERPFQVLKALIARPGELVTREELRRSLWSPDTFVDFDNSLNTAVTKLREALGDTAEDHRFIETLARRGYRFVAPVTDTGDQAPAPPPPAVVAVDPVPSTPPPVPAGRVRRRAVVVITTLAAAVAIGWGYRVLFDAAKSRLEKSRIVVLPFENLTGDAGQDFLSDGFTEETIARLGQLYADDLGVIARTSAMSYKNARKRVAEIGRELSVDYVLEGSLLSSGDRLRVTAQLIHTADETHVWANTYDRDARDVLEVQREIVVAVAEAIQARLARSASLAAGPARASVDRRHDDPIAYEHYLRGRYLWNQRKGTSTRAALEYFQQAIDRQPRYAIAFAGMADAYIILGASAEMPTADAYAKARAAALKALELDETLAGAHVSLAALAADFDWDWPLAEAHFTRALALNPNDVTGHHWYSEYLMRVGRSREAIAEAEAARRADPLSPNANVNYGFTLVRARRYEDGIAWLRQTRDIFPDFGLVHSALGLAHSHQGKPREALEHFQRFREIFGETPDAVAFLGLAHGRAGETGRAREALATLDRLAARQYVPGTHRALVYMGLGDRDAALHWLERAVEARDWHPGFLAVDPLYDSLRGDARFDRLVARVGLPR